MPELEPEAATELLPRARAAEPEPAASPVFVDVSGRRRRVAHRFALAAFVAAAGYSIIVIWSLLGGPVSPDSLMPFSAPHPAASASRSAPSASRPAASAAGLPAASLTSGAGATAAAPSSPGPAAPKASTTASGSAAATGHRRTTPPGKPTASPTTGHGH